MANKNGQKERLKDFIKYLEIPTKTFEERCGLSNGYVSSIRKGIGYRAIEQITEHYPNLNPIWLIAGEGEMLLSEENKEENKQTIPSEILETLYNEAREEKKKLLSIIENQQDIIKKQSETILSQQRTIESLEGEKDIADSLQDAHAG